MTFSHHATLIRVFSVESKELSEFDENIEVLDTFTESIGIDDARDLVRSSYNRPANAVERVFVVRTNFITLEAQNALLKILEEPPLSTRFVFIIPIDFSVLPTLISRFDDQTNRDEETEAKNEAFGAFMTDSYKDRLASIEKASKQKDVEWQRSIKSGLIEYIYQSAADSNLLKGLEYTARLLLTRGASNKMLLEHAALILPTR